METKYVRIPFEVELAKKISNGEAEGKIFNDYYKCYARIVDTNFKTQQGKLNIIISEIAANIERFNFCNDEGFVFFDTKNSFYEKPVFFLEVPEYMTFKDGDIVAFGSNNNHVGIFKCLNLEEKTFSSYATLANNVLVFYEPAWNLINIHIATEEQKQRIVNALKSCEVPKAKGCLKKLGIEEKTKYEFKPFDKVLVRDNDNEKWGINLFERYDEEERFPYMCLDECFNQCIPYNEKTAHLLGTTDNYEE